MKVVKKDNTKEPFNVQKVVIAVNKSAFRALVKFTDEEIPQGFEPYTSRLTLYVVSFRTRREKWARKKSKFPKCTTS